MSKGGGHFASKGGSENGGRMTDSVMKHEIAEEQGHVAMLYDLYVAVTRATRQLVVITPGELPAVLSRTTA